MHQIRFLAAVRWSLTHTGTEYLRHLYSSNRVTWSSSPTFYSKMRRRLQRYSARR